jgi:hypothetical protein
MNHQSTTTSISIYISSVASCTCNTTTPRRITHHTIILHHRNMPLLLILFTSFGVNAQFAIPGDILSEK